MYLCLQQISQVEVEADDASIKSYIASNPERFTFAEETRAIDYVTFDVVASREDSLNFKSDLEDITSSFTAAEDDSIFVRLQSENNFAGTYFTLDQLPADIADDVFNTATGDVYGPYLDGVDFVLAKIMTKKLIQILFRQGIFYVLFHKELQQMRHLIILIA